MLKKLLKHEWKDIYKLGSLMVLAVAAVTLLGCILIKAMNFSEIITNGNASEGQMVVLVIGCIMSVVMYVLLLVGVTYGMMIFLGVRFYRTMYTDEGYLLHTLPVTHRQIFFSKVLMSGIWYLLIELVVVLSVALLGIFLFSDLFGAVLASTPYTFWELAEMVLEEMEIAYAEMGISLTSYVVTIVVMGLVGPFITMITLFGAITIGQLSKKHKGMMGILTYFGILFISMVISMAVQLISSIGALINASNDVNGYVSVQMNNTYLTSLIINIAIAVIMYVVSHIIISKKLNLD